MVLRLESVQEWGVPKAAPREKNLVHSLTPIDTFGGNQRLIRNAISKGYTSATW